MKKIKWGIMGTGTIASSFVKGLEFLEDAELYAVASRSIEKASEFGKIHGSKKCYGSYDEMVKATSATLSVIDKEPVTVNMPLQGNGYNYEAAAVMECIRNNKLECNAISLDESLSTMRIMDELRNQYGIVFPIKRGNRKNI